MDKYDVAGQRIDGKVVAQRPLGELGKIAKAILYFLKQTKNIFVKSMRLERP